MSARKMGMNGRRKALAHAKEKLQRRKRSLSSFLIEERKLDLLQGSPLPWCTAV